MTVPPEAAVESASEAAVRRARIVPSGPILVEGPLRIEAPDGTTVESDRFMVAICTCRRSKTYPLCDTSHRKRKPAARTSDEPSVEVESAAE